MKMSFFSKKKAMVLTGLLTAASFFSSAQAQDMRELLCSADVSAWEMDSQQVSPFIDIDYKAIYAKLDEYSRNEVIDIDRELQGSFALLDDGYIAESDESFRRLMQLEDRKHQIICDSGVEIVTIDLLSKLTPEQRAKALSLWEDVQKAEKTMRVKYAELDTLLENADL